MLQKDQWKEIQKVLKAAKLYTTKIDGIPGPNTKKALMNLAASIDDPKEKVVEPVKPTPVPTGNATNPVVIEGDFKIVVVKGAKFKKRGKYKTKSGRARGLVVHFTVSGRSAKNAENVVKYLASKGLGCPVIDEDGTMYVAEDFNWYADAVSHAGVSEWQGVKQVSDYNVGLEICNWGTDGRKRGATDLRTIPKNTENQFKGEYQKFTDAQEKTILEIAKALSVISPDFASKYVCGHDECCVPKGRKNDPGGSLSMTMPELRKKIAALTGK